MSKLLKDMADKDNRLFLADVERVRELLQKKKALDLEEMLLGGFQDGLLVASLPAHISGRG